MESELCNKKAQIASGDGVVLSKGSSLKYISVKPNRKERMENFVFMANQMIGKPFGSAFKANNKMLIQIDPKIVANYDDEEDVDLMERDNRSILDDSSAQTMSRDDIMKLKESGQDGQKIVERIRDSSATFKDKNVYSRAKYVNKKKKKHLAHFITHQPTARLLCQLVFQKAPGKIQDMRPDTLAQILTWSNVQSGSKVLVVESCQGLLLGSILERLGNEGQIVQGYASNFPVRVLLDQFNFSQKTKSDMICGFPLEKLEEIKKVIENGGDVGQSMAITKEDTVDSYKMHDGTEKVQDEKSSKDDQEKELASDSRLEISGSIETNMEEDRSTSTNCGTIVPSESSKDSNVDKVEGNGQTMADQSNIQEEDSAPKSQASIPQDEGGNIADAEMDTDDIQVSTEGNESSKSGAVSIDNIDSESNLETDVPKSSEPFSRYTKERAEIEEERAMTFLKEKKLDSLIIASKFRPLDLLVELLDFIRPSAPIVIYCQYREPLMECYEYLRDQSLAMHVIISETWLRDIQVLPNRTHPTITMSGRSGYILRGMTLKKDEEDDMQPSSKKVKEN